MPTQYKLGIKKIWIHKKNIIFGKLNTLVGEIYFMAQIFLQKQIEYLIKTLKKVFLFCLLFNGNWVKFMNCVRK
jgi:hypothetical protein